MSIKQLPPLEYLKELFTYNKETGSLTWKTRPVEHFKSQRVCNMWNAKSSGKEAGSSQPSGYILVSVGGARYQHHRLSYYLGTGEVPDKIDHINGIIDDNRLCNLRSVAHKDNMRNKKRPTTNTSGTMGVYCCKASGKWRAVLGRKHLGYHTDKIDAIYARHYAQADANYHTNHGRVQC